MNKNVVVVDYGSGNIFSISQALAKCDAKVEITSNPEVIAKAKHLLIPGVGAFGECFARFQEKGLVEAVMENVAAGGWLLGICVGMQVLFTESEEYGIHPGLNIMPGRVERMPSSEYGGPERIPFIGWKRLQPPVEGRWEKSIFAGITMDDTFYFVHSYMAVPVMGSHRLADTCYGRTRVCAAAQKDNVIGCQFHPEKSGESGLKLLNNFLALS